MNDASMPNQIIANTEDMCKVMSNSRNIPRIVVIYNPYS